MTPKESLGDILRRRRLELKITIQQLAEQSGVSRAAISKIERGDSGASTPVLGKLSEALDLSISQLIGGADRNRVVHIPAQLQPVYTETASGFERRSLSPLYRGRGVDVVLNRLPAGAHTGPFPSHRPGVEEHLFVASGQLVVSLDDKKYDLKTGDFLFYQADHNHAFENPGDEVCEYFLVIDSTRSA